MQRANRRRRLDVVTNVPAFREGTGARASRSIQTPRHHPRLRRLGYGGWTGKRYFPRLKGGTVLSPSAVCTQTMTFSTKARLRKLKGGITQPSQARKYHLRFAMPAWSSFRVESESEVRLAAQLPLGRANF